MKYLDYALSFIAPHHCLNCQTEGEVCCQKCLEEIADPRAGLICYKCANPSYNKTGICSACFSYQNIDSVSWYADYSDPIASELVKSLKFEHVYAAYHPMAVGICGIFSSLSISSKAFITAIPTANNRIRHRGWDQAKLIAKATAKHEKLAYKSLLLRSSSFDQIGSSRSERAAASKNFFKTTRRSLISGQTIILLDDVLTTGSTLDSAAKALKSAGAKEVHAVTFARQGLKSEKAHKFVSSH